jgi:Flp pilus assembly protein TadB
MDDRERLQWLVAQARRGKRTSRANVWGITLLHASPLLAACLLALLLGRPEIAAATLALALLTLGLVRTAVRPRRMVMAPARLRAVRYGR